MSSKEKQAITMRGGSTVSNACISRSKDEKTLNEGGENLKKEKEHHKKQYKQNRRMSWKGGRKGKPQYPEQELKGEAKRKHQKEQHQNRKKQKRLQI